MWFDQINYYLNMLRVLQSQQPLCHTAPNRPEIVEETSKSPAPVSDQFPISSSKSCPPGPWASGAVVSSASTLQPTPTLAPPLAGAKHNDKSKSTMISSYSVTQRLNNQLSLDGSNASASGHNYMPVPRAHPGTTPTYENSINPTSLSQSYQVESQVTI